MQYSSGKLFSVNGLLFTPTTEQEADTINGKTHRNKILQKVKSLSHSKTTTCGASPGVCMTEKASVPHVDSFKKDARQTFELTATWTMQTGSNSRPRVPLPQEPPSRAAISSAGGIAQGVTKYNHGNLLRNASLGLHTNLKCFIQSQLGSFTGMLQSTGMLDHGQAKPITILR